MSVSNDVYVNYNAMVGDVSEGLSNMSKLCEQLGMNENAVKLRESKKKLQSHKFAVGILGEFKRGKSTVINALLGKEIIPADILPCSATMNRVSYDFQPSVQLKLIDGTTEQIEIEDLSRYVTKLDEESEYNAEQVEEAIVFYPCRFCQNGVDIIDTPGLNDDERMTRITEETVPKLDAVIMVLVPGNPFSISEAEFVRNKLMCSDIGRLIFLVNKIDTVRPKDRARCVEGIRTKIKESVLNKTAAVYGEDSEQYRSVQQKMADIRIYPISAQNALDGRVGVCEDQIEDDKLVKSSGILEFEESLSKMLTEERGFLELGTPLATVMRVAEEAKKKIRTYIEALDVDQETFLKVQREKLLLEKNIREDKLKTKQNIMDKSDEIISSLNKRVGDVYSDIEASAMGIIDQMSFAQTELRDDALKQEIVNNTLKEIESSTSERISIFCERAKNEIDGAVGKEALKVADFINSSNLKLSELQFFENGEGFDKQTAMIDAAGIAVDVLTDFMGIYGVGGVVTGYRAAGVKGALLGGGLGLAANIGAASLLVGMGVVGLPMVIISCVAGSGVSKLICNLVFKNNKENAEIEKIKESLRTNVKAHFSNIAKDRLLEKWIEGTVSSQFDMLSNSMEDQCESVIRESENAINKIKMDMALKSQEKEAAKNNYLELVKSIDSLVEGLEPLRQKLLQY